MAVKRTASAFRRIIFKALPFELYLLVLSKAFFITYSLGILKAKELYKYHYFLKKIIRKGDVIIDIGANLGYFARLFSKWTGSTGKVYAVEPVKPVIGVLKKNTGGLGNVTLYPYALGSENKHIKLGNDSRADRGFIASGGHYVLDKNVTEKKSAFDEFPAEMKKGSELFGGLEKLDFIKCDVEGYESVIIPEMEKLLVKHKPSMLIESRYQKRIDLLNYLSDLGYLGFVLENGKLESVQIDRPGDDAEDILFFHPVRKDIYSPYLK